MEKQRYQAFISYRHKPLDVAAAKAIHTSLENFRIPSAIRKISGLKKVGRCFRDQDELPTSSDLAQDITDALENSNWLIVVCTPDTPKSKWCMAEIDTFIRLHGRSRVLAVLADGEPDQSFPESLRFETLPDGSRVEREPLAADLRSDGLPGMKKKLRIEKLRLLAPILGVGFDDLRRRARERVMKTALVSSAAAAVFFALFGGYTLNQAALISRQNTEILQKNDELTAQIEETERQRAFALANEAEAKRQAEIAQANETEAKHQAGIALANEELAKENEARAILNEAEAKRQAGIALTNEELAKENEARAVLNELEAVRQTEIALSNEELAKENEARAVMNEAEANRQAQTVLGNQSRFLAAQSIAQTGNGDRVTGTLLALEALPKNLHNPERPLLDEAVTALRNSRIPAVQGRYMLTGGVYRQEFGGTWSYLENDRVLWYEDAGVLYFYDMPSGRLIGQAEGSFTAHCPASSLIIISRGSGYSVFSLRGLTRPVFEFERANFGNNVSFEANGRYLLHFVQNNNNREYYAEVYETSDWTRVCRLNAEELMPGADTSRVVGGSYLSTVTISPDGKYLLANIGRPAEGMPFMSLFELPSGRNVTPPGQELYDGEWIDFVARDMRFSPDGRLLRVIDYNYGVHLFEFATGRLLNSIIREDARTAYFVQADFSPDSKWMIVFVPRNTMAIYNAVTGGFVRENNPQLGHIDFAGFTERCTLIFRRSDVDGLLFMPLDDMASMYTVILPDLHIPQVSSLASSSPLRTLQAHADGFTMFSARGVYQLWERAPDVGNTAGMYDISWYGDPVRNNDFARVFSPGGRRFAVSDRDYINIYDTSSLELLLSAQWSKEQTMLQQLFWLPDGNRLLGVSFQGAIYIMNASNGAVIHEWPGSRSPPYATLGLVSPCGRYFAMNNQSSIGGMYDLDRYEKLYNLPGIFSDQHGWGSMTSGHAFDFSPCGELFYLGSMDGLAVITARTGGLLQTFPYRPGNTIAVSPDGKKLFFSGNRAEEARAEHVFVVDAVTGAELWHSGISVGVVGKAAWSPDGKYVAVSATSATSTTVGASRTTVLDGATGEIAGVFDGVDPIFSPDSRFLLVSGSTFTISRGSSNPHTGCVLYDLESGKEVVRLHGHGIMSPGGDAILMLNTIWRMKPLETLIREAREQLAGRELTDGERRRFYIN
jgi:WD40 repeat protein